MKFRLAALAALALCSTATHAALTNGGFENPVFTANNWYPVASIPGWTATPSNANIEVWAQPYLNVAAYEGNQFVELNSNLASTIYQDISSVAGQSVGYTFAHRGRAGTDTMSFTATDLGADGISANNGSKASGQPNLQMDQPVFTAASVACECHETRGA